MFRASVAGALQEDRKMDAHKPKSVLTDSEEVRMFLMTLGLAFIGWYVVDSGLPVFTNILATIITVYGFFRTPRNPHWIPIVAGSFVVVCVTAIVFPIYLVAHAFGAQ
jgi:hypothetical protein